MNNTDIDFVRTIKEVIVRRGEDLTKPVVLSNRTFLASIRNFYGYGTHDSVAKKARHLASEGLIVPNGVDFVLTEKAKSL